MKNKIKIRQAEKTDLNLLFEISTQAMAQVDKLLHKGDIDKDKEFKKYKKAFKPEKINIIVFDGKDVGRLRIVESEKETYIGGIQILPKFQRKGIGSFVMFEIISKAKKSKKDIKLEVHNVNKKAFAFYKKLGFEVVDKNKNQKIMKYFYNKK